MALYNLNNEYDALSFKEKVKSLLTKRSYVELKAKHTTRSLSQNAYLHVLLGLFACEYGISIEEAKIDFFKRECNRDIFEKARTNKFGKEVKYLRSSADLDKAQMTTAIERFRNYAVSVAGIYLPAPNEYDHLFYAQQLIEQNKEYL